MSRPPSSPYKPQPLSATKHNPTPTITAQRVAQPQPAAPEPFLTPWDKGYWTPQRRHSLKILNYSLPIVIGCGYALYLQLYDVGTRQRVLERERQREERRLHGEKEQPLNIIEVLTQKLPEEPDRTKR